MTTVTVHAGTSGTAEEVTFGAGDPAAGPPEHGEGPSPYDYLLMALGA
jgi:uncharacterized OsmC-like protein